MLRSTSLFGVMRCWSGEGPLLRVRDTHRDGTNFRPCKNLFTIFLNTIFTSFIVRLFTNSFDATRDTTVKSCVVQTRISD